MFSVIHGLTRAIPDALPGKRRVARFALRALDRGEPVHVPDRFGNTLWCPSLREPIAESLFACGVYEPDTLAAISSHLPEHGVYLDVGANIGALALPVAALHPHAKVICVEADPDIAAALRGNATRNGRGNVTVLELLAGAQSQASVPFYRAPDRKFGMGSIGPQFGDAPVELSQRALDEVLDELGVPSVDVVKLDVEGAELGALRGLERRLAGPNPPTVIFEFADWAEARIPGQQPGDAQRYLMQLGYRLSRLAGRRTGQTPRSEPMTSGSAMLVGRRAGNPT